MRHGRTARAVERLLAWLLTGKPYDEGVWADWDWASAHDPMALDEVERLMALADGWTL